MTPEPAPPPMFSDQELASMRKDVLEWIQQPKRKPRTKVRARAPRASESETSITAAKSRPRRKRKPASALASPATPAVENAPPTVPQVARAATPVAEGKKVVPRDAPARPSQTATPPRRDGSFSDAESFALETEKEPDFSTRGVHNPARRGALHVARSTAFAAAVAISALVVMFAFLFGVYMLGWSGTTVAVISQYSPLPLPAAYAAGEILTLHDFFADIRALSRTEGLDVSGTATVRSRVIERFAHNAALRRAAQNLGVAIARQNIQRQLDGLIAEVGGRQNFLAVIGEKFPGWSVDQFRAKVLEPYLLRQQIVQVLRTDPENWKPAERQIEDVRREIVSGKIAFADAAQHHRQNARAQSDGDLGYRSADDLEAELYAPALALAVGEISAPIRTARGFHLLRVSEKIPGDGVAADRLRVHEILIAPIFDPSALVRQELLRRPVRRLVP